MASSPAASSGRSSRVVKLLNARGASRAIETRKIPRKIVRDMIEAARLAPSCFNNQPWRFLFLEGHDALVKGREALSEGNRLWASRAPLLIVAHSRRQDDCLPKDGRQYHEFDLGLACANLMLAATEHGLTCRPMAGFDPAALREAFHLAEDEKPLIMFAVGYESADESFLPEAKRGLGKLPRARKAAGEIVKRL